MKNITSTPVSVNTHFRKIRQTVKRVYQATGFALVATFMAATAQAGFSVSGTQLLDDNGQSFVMRGINHPHTWYTGETGSFADIAATGANTVRVVLSDGQQWSRNSAADVANVISLCKQNQLICVLEVHDVTGSGESAGAGTLANAAQYWVDIASVLKGEEDYVIINIANEPFGNNTPASTWVNEHRDAIQTLRNAGLTHTLMIDAANWGQDWEEIMLNNASDVADADSLNNTMFSVHMYEVYQNRSKVENYVSTFLSRHNLPLIVGEFGADHQGNAVDADSIMAVAEQYNIGYMGWSWSGNGSCCTSLDIVNNFNASSLTSWGDRLINGANGIASTSQTASVYNGGSSTTTLLSRVSGKCVDVSGQSTANGANIAQWDCWGGDNQQFEWKALGNGYHQLVAQHSGKCIRVLDGDVFQYDCHDNYWTEMFERIDAGSGHYILKNRNSGSCLRVEGSSGANGANIVLAGCDTSWWSQQFSFD